jgi:lysophospholipase L1-like esterase
VVRAAVSHGQGLAQEVIAARDRKRKKGALEAKKGPSNGLLIAEGDSWFDYPFFNVLERLEDKFNFIVESVAHKGDTVESIAYDASQVSKLARLFEKLGAQGHRPRAILLSGGGNDIAGAEFPVLLNHKTSGLPVLNDSVVDGVINERLKFAVVSVISAVTALSQRYFSATVPVVMHGYAHPVPDGRGYLGGAWVLPGPWLKPGFIQKGYDEPQFCTDVMAELIKRFNDMLQTVPGAPGLGHVTYLDLRRILNNQLGGGAYRKDWGDELHPTRSGFEAVAAEFARVLQGFPMAGGLAPHAMKAAPARAKARRAARKKN